MSKSINRRSFVRNGLTIAGATTMGAGLLTHSSPLLAQGSALSTGDAAMLRFAAAAEILETDLWVQYNELGGIQDSEVPGGTGNKFYTSKLANLDAKFPQYNVCDARALSHSFIGSGLQAGKSACQTGFARSRGCGAAAEHAEDVVDGILHTLSAFVHDVDTFGGQVADLETVVTLGDGYVDLVRTHGGSVLLR
jgi:hypothetical protein